MLDTNTAVSGLLWPGGPPGQLIDAAEAGRIELASSPALLAELRDVLSRDKFAKVMAQRNVSAADLFDGYAALVRLVWPEHTPRVIERDPDDDHVLACAIAAHADLIVSGDRHLTELGSYRGIRVLKAAAAIQAIGVA